MSINRMPKLREKMNLFYYNIFRFERFTQYLASVPILGFLRLVGLGDAMVSRSGKEKWDEHILEVLNDPKDGFSILSTGNHVAILSLLCALTLLNVVCTILQLEFHTFWFYGGITASILAFVGSYYFAPTNPKKYLGDFKKFESMPSAQKRLWVIATFLIIVGIWAAFVTSFIFYLDSIISRK